MPERGYLWGTLWSGLHALAGVGLPLLVFVLFARLLPPAQIGTVALAVAATELLKAFGLPGLYESLLQGTGTRGRRHPTVAAVLMLASVALFWLYLVLVVVFAPAEGPAAVDPLLLGAIGLRILFDLPSLQPQARLAERLSYRRLALRSVFANATAGLIGAGLALAGEPLIGLVAYQVGQAVLAFLATVVGTSTLARPWLHGATLRAMAPEALPATGVRIVAAAGNQLDQVAMAALTGSVPLAYYNLAKRIETTFLTVGGSFATILFQPHFARSHTPAERAEAVRRGLLVLTLTCGLGAAVFAANHVRAVDLVFGPAWAEAAPVAAWLALGGYARALAGVYGALLSVSGHNRVLLNLSGISVAAGVGVVAAAAPHGLVLCAAALALKNALATAWLAHASRRGGAQAPAGAAPGVPGSAAARRDGGQPLLDGLLEALVPFAVMLAGAFAGARAAEALLPDAEGLGAVARTIAILAASGALAGLGGLAYLLLRHGAAWWPRAQAERA